jgi:hypothetical protein
MRRFHAALVRGFAAAAFFGALAGFAPAIAAPPTVTPSPGYDARLAQQRAAISGSPSLVRDYRASSRRHARRIRHGY